MATTRPVQTDLSQMCLSDGPNKPTAVCVPEKGNFPSGTTLIWDTEGLVG